MLLASALFALFLGGFWLYCLTDAILTPASECRGMPKLAWIAVIAVTFVGGAAAWLLVRQPVRAASHRLAPLPRGDVEDCVDDEILADTHRWTDADDAVARHPAGRALASGGQRFPKGPDDDPEFLSALDRVIRGSSGAGEEL
jgi:peptidoglycan/LPS O-acetylase OafA/YrhL